MDQEPTKIKQSRRAYLGNKPYEVPAGPKAREGFAITRHSGFHMTFENGYGISAQWGPCNYGSNYSSRDFEAAAKSTFYEADTVEVAIFDPYGDFWRPPHLNWGDDVVGYQTADQVVKLMAMLVGLPGIEKKKEGN